MIYGYFRVVVAGDCRRSALAIGLRSGCVPERSAAILRARLDFSGKKLDVTTATAKARRQIWEHRERSMTDHAIATVNGILIATVVIMVLLVKVWT